MRRLAGSKIMPRHVKWPGVLLVACASALPLPLSAGQSQSSMRIAVAVADYTRVTLLHQDDELTIAPADLRRGYVDVSRAVGVRILSNHPQGHRILLVNALASIASLEVEGLVDHAVTLEASGGAVLLAHGPSAEQDLELSYRFYLKPGTVAGTYEWPVRLVVEPV